MTVRAETGQDGGTRERVVQEALFPAPEVGEPVEAPPRTSRSPGLVSFSPPALARFDRLAAVVVARPPRGVTLRELATIGALCRELDEEEPDVERVAELLEDLELSREDLEVLEASP